MVPCSSSYPSFAVHATQICEGGRRRKGEGKEDDEGKGEEDEGKDEGREGEEDEDEGTWGIYIKLYTTFNTSMSEALVRFKSVDLAFS